MQLHRTTHVTIYALCDPDTGVPHYVGQTSRPLAIRLAYHCRDLKQSRSQRASWMRTLRACGKQPTIVALETTDGAHADEREYAHIERLLAEGHPLTNVLAAQPVRSFVEEREMPQEDDGGYWTNAEGENFVSISEAAQLLGVHANTIRYRIRKGVYPAHKVLTPHGEAYVVPRAALLTPEANGASHGADNVVGDLVPYQDGLQGALQALEPTLQRALAPLVDELARARADAAAAHERAGRLQAERDAAIVERNVERTRRYEREQRRPWWRRLWGGS